MGRDQGWGTIADKGLVECVVHPASSAEQAAAFTEIHDRHAPAVLAYCGGKLTDPDSALDAAAEPSPPRGPT